MDEVYSSAISAIHPIGDRWIVVTAGPRMKVMDLRDANPVPVKAKKLRNKNGAKESSTISGISSLALSRLLLIANEDGNFFLVN